jgi:hypothetical protein
MLALVVRFLARCWRRWLRPEVAPAIDRLPGGGGLARWTYYRDGWRWPRIIPLIGAGLGSFMMLYSTYQLLLPRRLQHVHAHNLLLDVAIEQGRGSGAAPGRDVGNRDGGWGCRGGWSEAG